MGFFDHIYLGAGSGDSQVPFREPQTRPALFRLVLRNRLWDMILLNLLYLLFCVPALAWGILSFGRVDAVLSETGGAAVPELIGVLHAAALGMVPCLVLAGTADAGIAAVMRNWSRREHAFIVNDFFRGIRNNFRQAFCCAVISAIRPMIVYWYAAFWLSNPGQIRAGIFPAVLCAVILLLWSVAHPVICVMMITYELKLTALIRNGMIMVVAHLATSVLIALLAMMPAAAGTLILLFVSLKAGTILLVVYLGLYAFSFAWLVYASYANRLCEELINPRIGERTGIGLHHTEDEG